MDPCMTQDNPYSAPGPPEATRRRARGTLPDQVDVAIVGCGLGGLTAGAYLAQQGQRVACFDGHYVAGGSATMFGRGSKDARYNFDIGLHYVGDCEPGGGIPSMLDDLGLDVTFLPLDPDAVDTLVFDDFEFAIPANISVYRERLLAQFPKERKGIDRYLGLLAGVREVGTLLDKNRGKMSPKILWKILSRHRTVARYQNATIGAFLDSCTKNIQLKAVMLGQNGDYGLPPSKVSALLHAGLSDHYFKGAYYPKGGGQVLADTLAATIEAHGGSIHLRQPIGEIIVEDGRAVGVRTEARRNHEAHTVRARKVISNADITRTLTELVGVEHLPSSWQSRIETFEMPMGLFITCLGVQTDLASLGMRRGNYWMFDQYDFDAMYTQIGQGDKVPTAHAAYITSASLKDPGNPHHGPKGVQTLEVMTMLPGDPAHWGITDKGAPWDWGYKRNERYEAHKTKVENELIGFLERRFPGASDAIVFRESATPVTHSRYTRALAGTSYGLSCTPAQFGGKRPGYSAVIPGLHLCGASTRSGHGIVGAMSSGRAAANAVMKALAT
ncbi:MAG: all-trans-retinol 13,14-reductase [Myxococcota bacterium]|jgi:all-trans-retinol 13,14-reductase